MESTLKKELGGDIDQFGTTMCDAFWILDCGWNIRNLIGTETIRFSLGRFAWHHQPLIIG